MRQEWSQLFHQRYPPVFPLQLGGPFTGDVPLPEVENYSYQRINHEAYLGQGGTHEATFVEP